MSEFSLSYHVADLTPEQVCERLLTARMPAYVLSAGEHWTTFTTSSEMLGLDLVDDDVLALFDEPLLAYALAEYHGFSIQVYDEGDLVVDYDLAWDCDSGPDAVEIRCDSDDVTVLHRLGRERGSKLGRKELAALLRKHESAERILSSLHSRPNFVDQIMTHLRIEHHDWLSFAYLEADLDSMASREGGPCWVTFSNGEPSGEPFQPSNA